MRSSSNGTLIQGIILSSIGDIAKRVAMILQNRKIKKFELDGVAKDGETIIRLRKELEDRILDDMRHKGYVPIIDILPQLYWSYNKDKDLFDYSIVIFGIYVGTKKATEILGILDDRIIKIEPTVEKEDV